MNPVDVIANAMRIADGNHTMGTGHLAEVVAGALTDERIVAIAVARLETEGREVTPDLIGIVRTVLGSVGGA